ncbi:MAG: T9SS type A sorting domain-containing protein [Flavobacterium sp.]|nr:T9SS type A sorting domain-containing protein [Flavobacterium sp.]
MRKITLLMLIVFTITSQGQTKLLSSINQYYNGSSWENSRGYNYEYDGNNNLITETNLAWENGVWKIRDKTTYTYNANNKVTQEVGQEWNTTTNALENSYRDTYTYTSGNLTGQIAEIWENSNWVNEWRNDITFINNLPQSALFYNWVGSQWVLDSRETLTYNGNNKITSSVTEDWVGSQWVNSGKSLLAYNASNQILNIRYAEWDDFNLNWKEYYRTDYVLDATGNRISEVNTDITANTKYKQEGNYDTSSLMSNFAHPFKDKSGVDYLFEDFPFVNKILSTNQYWFDTATNTYNAISSRNTYNYNSAITLSVEQPEIVNTTISVFPNPTTSVLNLNFSEAVTIDKIVVVDITGKTVLQQGANTTQVNVEKLTAGLYIIEAYSGKDKFTSKFVKK